MLRHNERVYDTTISPDGKKAATRTESGVIHIWNAENGMILNTYTPKKSVYDPHFVDEHTLIFWDYNGIYCIDADSLDEKWSYKWSHARFGIYMAVSSDRSKAALADMDLTVLDTATGQPLMEISLNNCFPDMEFVHGSNIVFDESGSFIFFSVDDGRIAKVDLEQRKITQVYPAAYDYVTGLAISPDHSLCCLFGTESRIVDTSTLEIVEALSGPCSEAAFFNDNSKIILGSYKGLYLLDVPGRAIVKKAETADPKGLRLSHDNSMLALISSGSSVKLFDATNLEEKLTIECPGPSPESVFFDPSGKTIFISFSDFTIGRYSTADGTLTGMLDKKVEEVDDILYSLDRNIYITKGMHEAYIWKLDTHKPIGHIRGLRMADLESGRLYVGFYSKLFVLSLYDTQMLLDEAEKQLQGRTLTPEEKKRLFIVE